MITIKRFCRLEKTAREALEDGDLKTIELINQDEELRSANVQFVIRGDTLYLGLLSSEKKDAQP